MTDFVKVNKEMYTPLAWCAPYSMLSVSVPYGFFRDDLKIECAEISAFGHSIAIPAVKSLLPFNGVTCGITYETISELKQWVANIEKTFCEYMNGNNPDKWVRINLNDSAFINLPSGKFAVYKEIHDNDELFFVSSAIIGEPFKYEITKEEYDRLCKELGVEG